MSFKTSVLIWFSRSRGTQPHPFMGWGFCMRQKNMGFRQNDKETYFSMTWVLKTW